MSNFYEVVRPCCYGHDYCLLILLWVVSMMMLNTRLTESTLTSPSAVDSDYSDSSAFSCLCMYLDYQDFVVEYYLYLLVLILTICVVYHHHHHHQHHYFDHYEYLSPYRRRYCCLNRYCYCYCSTRPSFSVE
jgi:hypothetical protein